MLNVFQDVDVFVYEIGAQETSLEKRVKLDRLKLTAEEWERLDLFANLLGVSLPTLLLFYY